MKRGSTLVLKFALIMLALAALAVCAVGLPALIKSDKSGLYTYIFIGMYLPAIPFFIALYQAFKLLTHIDQNKAFSEFSIKALRNIKYCGIAISAMFAAGMPFIYYVAEKDDAPGVILIGMILIFASFVIAVFAGVLQKLVQNAVDIKSENDLTV